MASLSCPLSSCWASGLLNPSRSPDQPPPAALFYPRRSGASVAMRARGRWVASARKRYKGTAMREERLAEMIERKVAEAMQACEGEEGRGSDGCRVAWDEVEEVSQAKANLRQKIAEAAGDPLEPFCRENPEAEECLICEG